jgi:hypothetical protein
VSLFSILVDIAANTAQFTAGIEQVEHRLESFGDNVRRIGETVAAGAFAEFVEHIIDVGAELERDSIKAGVAADAFSELAYASKQQGVGTDALTAALIKMNRAISEAGTGAKKPTEALAAMGLTFKDLKNLTPDQQFELIAQRISQLGTAADRSRAEIDIFGKSGGQLGALFEEGAAGIEKMRKEAQQVGASFSEDTLQKLEEAHKSIDKLESSFSGMATTLTAKVAPALSRFFGDVTANLSGDSSHFAEGNIKALQSTLGQYNLSVYAMEQLNKRIRAIDLQEGLKQLVIDPKTLQGAADLQKMLDQAANTKPPGYQTPFDINSLKVTVSAQKESVDKMTEFYDRLDKLTETDVEKTVSAYEEKRAALTELYQSGVIDAQEYASRSKDAVDKALGEVQISGHFMLKTVKDNFTEMELLADQAARGIEASFTNFLMDPTAKGFRNMVQQWIVSLEKMAAEALTKNIFQALFGECDGGKSGSGLGGILAGIASSLFGGGKAVGGPVQSGTTYLVGEHGPELFTPGAGGTITPNGAMSSGGGGNLHFAPTYNIDARGADAQRIMAMMPAMLAQTRAATIRDLLDAFKRQGYPAPRTV